VPPSPTFSPQEELVQVVTSAQNTFAEREKIGERANIGAKKANIGAKRLILEVRCE
jgi:hypothetical protein